MAPVPFILNTALFIYLFIYLLPLFYATGWREHKEPGSLLFSWSLGVCNG